MESFPSDLKRRILLKLPVDDRLRVRTVNKAWCAMVDDFAADTLIVQKPEGSGLFTLSLDSLTKLADGHREVDGLPVKSLNPPLPSYPVASCNGLILLVHPSLYMDWAVWNPSTGEIHVLPLPNSEIFVMGCGFGYDGAADDYKVVRIEKLFSRGSAVVHRTLVYSLRECSWRAIRNSCPCSISSDEKVGVYLNGALHWKSGGRILALDLASERYWLLSLPAGTPYSKNLDVLAGYLAVSYYCEVQKAFIGWVKKDYRVETSWTKVFSLERLEIEGSMENLRPMAYWEIKGNVLLRDKTTGGLIWWDMEHAFGKEVVFRFIPNSPASYQICHTNPTQLNQIVGGSVSLPGTAARLEKLLLTIKHI